MAVSGEVELFEIIASAGETSATGSTVSEFEMADGFMRERLGEHDGWREVQGKWRLQQHGAGLAESEAERRSSSFQRAVNPFSVIGSGTADKEGILCYDVQDSQGGAYVSEARFFFGRPTGVNPISRHQPTPQMSHILGQLSAPVPAFMISQGRLDGAQVAFGWWNEKWSLCFRHADNPWQTLKSWPGLPPRCTWVKTGVAVGNSSNRNYRLAGFGGNPAGTSYEVGTPKWVGANEHTSVNTPR